MAKPKVIHQGRKFRVECREVTYDDGSRHEIDIVVHPGAAVILPILDDGRIVMESVFRAPLGKADLELPAGTLEPPEAVIETARRELTEETGYVADSVELLISFYSCPGFCTEYLNVFLATGLVKGEQNLDAAERITVMPMTLAETLSAIDDGQIVDAKTIATLLYYERKLHQQGTL